MTAETEPGILASAVAEIEAAVTAAAPTSIAAVAEVPATTSAVAEPAVVQPLRSSTPDEDAIIVSEAA